MAIPKIIHQTWKNEILPAAFHAYTESWRKHHPQWEGRLWTDNDNRRFIQEHYPAFLRQYDSYPWPVQRVDAVRYFLLYHYGGLYVDLDFQCLRPIDLLLSGKTCVLGQEPRQHCLLHQRTRIVCNALMAAEPGHPFFRAVTEQLPVYAARSNAAQPVLSTTGPFMLSDVYDGFPRKDTIALMPAEHFYPLSMEEADEFRATGQPVDLRNAYAVHFYVGTWWRPDPATNDGSGASGPHPQRWLRWGRTVAAGTAVIAGRFWAQCGSFIKARWIPGCIRRISKSIASPPRRLQGALPGPMFRQRTLNARIPKELRFVWGLLGGGAMPGEAARYLLRWRELHPSWSVTVHDRHNIDRLAASYPEYPFAAYPKDIQRCDVCRLMLLHRYGGVYADLDVEPLACLEYLFTRHPAANVFLGVEVRLSRKEAYRIGREMAIRQGVPEVRRRIANYFMASVPGHPFWKEALELAKARASLPVRDQYDVLYTTGPDVITEALQRNARKFPDLVVVPQYVLKRFITHHQAGTWRDF